jgi:hypothetical protein
MGQIESEGDRRKRPYGVLGALVLILAIESTVARHAMDFTTAARFEWRYSRQAATREAPGCSVLGLGTSMTKLGLYPSVVERESGRRTYNLASIAGRLPGSFFLLRRALDAGARPDSVVLEVHPTYLATSFREGLTAWPDLLGPAECLDLAWSARDASFFLATCLARALPSLGARQEIRAAILATLRGEVGSTRSQTLPFLRNLTRNSGAFVHRRDTPYQGEVIPFLEAMYLNPHWASDPINEGYLRRVLDLCSSRGIRVYWLIPPMVPALQGRREQLGLEAAYNRFVERFLRSYPEMVVLDGRRSGYEAQVFMDAAHLDLPGATIFSAEVGRALRAGRELTQGRSRWVDLPAYRDRPIDAPLEEIMKSYQAVVESGVLKR